MMWELWRDVRFALRGIGRQPAFAAAVILTLGLGIGANVQIATVTLEFVHTDFIDVNVDADLQTLAASLALNFSIVTPFLSYSTLIGQGAGDVHVIGIGATFGF